MTGNVFNIQRFGVHDGAGIRTVVFLKGCPLSCAWCHNPESQSSGRELFYDPQKCIGCMYCAGVCPDDRHIFENGVHTFLRSGCDMCMRCAEVCPSRALEVCGAEKTTDAVLDEVLRDAEFYAQSGGGMTLSGGEPLAQYDFSLELLRKAKEHGLNTAVETSGFRRGGLLELNRYVDTWLYDVNLLPEEDHIRYTGVSNRIILENLSGLSEAGAEIILRCPIIPGINLNEEHFSGIAELVNRHKGVKEVDIEPYHPLGINKSRNLGRRPLYNNEKFLSVDTLAPYVSRLSEKVSVGVKIL